MITLVIRFRLDNQPNYEEQYLFDTEELALIWWRACNKGGVFKIPLAYTAPVFNTPTVIGYRIPAGKVVDVYIHKPLL